jgi:hypothetical protein
MQEKSVKKKVRGDRTQPRRNINIIDAQSLYCSRTVGLTLPCGVVEIDVDMADEIEV